jgi:hypothetical protein
MAKKTYENVYVINFSNSKDILIFSSKNDIMKFIWKEPYPQPIISNINSPNEPDKNLIIYKQNVIKKKLSKEFNEFIYNLLFNKGNAKLNTKLLDQKGYLYKVYHRQFQKYLNTSNINELRKKGKFWVDPHGLKLMLMKNSERLDKYIDVYQYQLGKKIISHTLTNIARAINDRCTTTLKSNTSNNIVYKIKNIQNNLFSDGKIKPSFEVTGKIFSDIELKEHLFLISRTYPKWYKDCKILAIDTTPIKEWDAEIIIQKEEFSSQLG